MKFEVYSWEKLSFHQWWKQSKNMFQNYKLMAEHSAFELPEITNKDSNQTIKSVLADSWVNKGQTPLGRSDHTAVWTGTEMIVWGGHNNAAIGYINSGGKYNPALDSWTPTSTSVNTPSARGNHTAVWTGSEMVIWGGFIGASVLNTGAIYNPATDVWRTQNTSNQPTARFRHTATWTGTQMMIWGGANANGTTLYDTGAQFNPSTNIWTTTSTLNAPDPRYNHSANLSQSTNGTEVIIWGGVGTLFTPVNSGARYNTTSNQWIPTSTGANVPTPRHSHSAVWAWTTDKTLIWGGLAGTGIGLHSGRIYDPVNDSWSVINNPNNFFTFAGRALAHTYWTGSEAIFYGGNSGSTFETNHFNGARYNLASDSWTLMTPTNHPSASFGSTSVWTGDEMIVWGGLSNGNYLDSGARYNPQVDEWTPTSNDRLTNPPQTRFLHTTIMTGNQMIIWGGSNFFELNTGSIYSLALDTWTATDTTNAPGGRYSHTSIWTGAEMIVWGGRTTSTALNTGGRFNPITLGWNNSTPPTTGDAPVARYDHSAVWSGDEMIIWGGKDGSTHFNNGSKYEFLPNTWTAMNNSSLFTPSPRTDHSAIWSGNEMIIWGGRINSTVASDGSLYDPNTDDWTPISNSSSPLARYAHSSIWTGNEMIIFGGNDGTTDLDSGSRYEVGLDSWTDTNSFNKPSKRSFHTAAISGNSMVVWGGTDVNGSLNTGSVYDIPTDKWSTMTTTKVPPARSGHTALFNGNEMFVWGGGFEGGNQLSVYTLGFDFTVGGTITGLNGSITLQNNAGDNIILNGGNSFTFSGQADGASYDVTILSQPAFQTCVVTNATGMINGADVVNVLVTCTTNQYTVGGTLSGLIGSITLKNFDTNEEIIMNSDGNFTFSLQDDGTHYDISHTILPPTQTCSRSFASGTLNGSNVTNVQINCVILSYFLGGNVSGLNTGNSVVLNVNNDQDVTVSSSSPSFLFQNEIDIGTAYTVTVVTQPTNQTCRFLNGSDTGTIANHNEITVEVECVNNYTIGGSITGLNGSVSLQLNGANEITQSSDGNFVFPEIGDGSTYDVTVSSQPANQTCVVTNGSGTLAGNNITNVQVNCSINTYTVGGIISGMRPTGGIIFLQLNGTVNLNQNADGNFSFPAMADGSSYNVVITSSPSLQTCTISNQSGTISGANVTNIEIGCSNNPPVANHDSFAILEDAPATTLDILANDAGLDAITITSITQPANGTVVNGTNLTYQPNADYCDDNNPDTFIYTVNGGDTATVSVSVNCVNDKPTFESNENLYVALSNTSNPPVQQLACHYDFGPDNEDSSQSISDFLVSVSTDADNILNSVVMNIDGTITYDFTGNSGTATINVSLQDDGGVANGGMDTSDVQMVTIHVRDYIFRGGFEQNTCQ